MLNCLNAVIPSGVLHYPQYQCSVYFFSWQSWAMSSAGFNVSQSAIFSFNLLAITKELPEKQREDKIKVRSLFVFHVTWSHESSTCARESGDGSLCQGSCLFAFFHPLHISQKSAWQFSATAFPHRTLHQIKCHHGFVFSLPIGQLRAPSTWNPKIQYQRAALASFPLMKSDQILKSLCQIFILILSTHR